MLGKQLATLLPAVNHHDIVICTHVDLDHADGVKSILLHWRQAKGGLATIGEFWLPGRWMDVAKKGLNDATASVGVPLKATCPMTRPSPKPANRLCDSDLLRRPFEVTVVLAGARSRLLQHYDAPRDRTSLNRLFYERMLGAASAFVLESDDMEADRPLSDDSLR